MTSFEPVQNSQPKHRLELVLEWSVLDPDRSRSLLLTELHLRVPEVESPLLPASCCNHYRYPGDQTPGLELDQLKVLQEYENNS